MCCGLPQNKINELIVPQNRKTKCYVLFKKNKHYLGGIKQQFINN